ncbi:transposase, IS4 family protein [Caballeronia catudaia]|uniref:Transposase, IS4 family protein n=1 Tax=Caballeronia catudaia TaxID=1777136 RepID=A0A158C3V4_9BURK|nr:transposase, IS4 family protein [Caballeronia catudaia]
MINDARQAVQDASAEITLGADKGYDAQEFIEACHEMKVTPHVAQNTSGRRSAVADSIATSVGYAISQQKRIRTVVTDIAKTILLPILIGMGLRSIFPFSAEPASNRVMTIAWIVLAVSAILLLVVHREHLVGLSWQGVLSLAALMVVALFVGQILGGPNTNDRTALAITCAMRHVGVALVVAAEFVGVRTLVLVMAYFVTAFIVSTIYLNWRRR